jgi:hypothetical protein
MVSEEAVGRGRQPRRRAPRLILAAAFAAAIAAGCVSPAPGQSVPPGSRQFRVPAVDEVLFGTWTATGGGVRPQGLRILAWGLVEGFAAAQDREPRWTGTSVIADSWAGEQGERWFREYRRWSGDGPAGDALFVLDRVSGDALTLESISSSAGWPNPSAMAESNPTYAAYLRQGPVP